IITIIIVTIITIIAIIIIVIIIQIGSELLGRFRDYEGVSCINGWRSSPSWLTSKKDICSADRYSLLLLLLLWQLLCPLFCNLSVAPLVSVFGEFEIALATDPTHFSYVL